MHLPAMMAAARETLLWFTSIIRGYHVYKEVWKPKIGLGSTARAMHDQHAVNSARMHLTASIKSGKYVCAYKKGAPNNPSLRYM